MSRLFVLHKNEIRFSKKGFWQSFQILQCGKRKKMKKITIIAGISVLALTGLAGCAQTDVIAKYGKSSFNEVVDLAEVKADDQYEAWSLSAPDGSARFLFSSNFKATAYFDVMMEIDAQPFIDAGLDASKLPDGMYLDGKIMVGQDLGEQEFLEDDQATFEASFAELIKLRRDTLGYHEAMAHYGIDLGDGNKFEWAKDLTANDKDIVFVLDPIVFADAGADVANISGWVYAKVEVMDESGNAVEVDKLLKPFNLK